MHIAYLAPAWPPAGAANGIVTYVAAMRRALIGRGHEVSVLSGGRLHGACGVHELDGAAARGSMLDRARGRVSRARGDQPAAGAAIARQLARAQAIARFDVVEMEESFGWPVAAQRALDVPVVVRLHGPEFMRPLEPGRRAPDRGARQRIAAEGRAIRDAPAISAPTAATLDATRRFYGRRLDDAVVFPNPIETDGGTSDERAVADDETVLFVGRFDHAKGADVLIDAFRRLAVQRPRARLVIVGPDAGLALPGGTRLTFDAYARRFLRAEIGERVRFMGRLDAPEIACLRRGAAVTVVASRAETFSYAAVEAMAAGCPVVLAGWPGSEELVTEGVDGWVTPAGDPVALARRIDWLLDHPQEAARAGTAAKRRCRDAFAADAVGRRAAGFLQQVIERHARR